MLLFPYFCFTFNLCSTKKYLAALTQWHFERPKILYKNWWLQGIKPTTSHARGNHASHCTYTILYYQLTSPPIQTSLTKANTAITVTITSLHHHHQFTSPVTVVSSNYHQFTATPLHSTSYHCYFKPLMPLTPLIHTITTSHNRHHKPQSTA